MRARNAALALCGAATRGWQRQGDIERAIDAARRRLELDETDEACHCELMQWLAATGRRTAAIAQYELLRQVLLDRLGARPSAASYELCRRIHADAPQAPLAGAATVSAAPETPSVPVPLPGAAALPLIGRTRELALIEQPLLDPECRLLTLLGPGGIGKTRLALAAAQAAAGRFADGVWFAGVAAGDEPPAGAEDPLLAVLAAQLSALRAGAVTSRDSVIRHFAQRECLLLLDNLEVAAPASARLAAELLAAAPRCKVLATSRVRLGAAREWLVDVGGLDCSGAEPLASPAAQLFCRHAQRHHAGFDAALEAPGVARLCAALEGHPLALELAARWVRSLDCAAIAARIGRAPDALAVAGAVADSEARHASITRVIADSWALLAPAAQQACRDLAMFEDSFDEAAAQAVCGVDAQALRQLIDHCWLRRDAQQRYGFHPLQREYAAAQLAAQPVLRERLAQVHLAHFAALLPPSSSAPGAADGVVLRDAGNLRQALREACRRAAAAELVPLVECYVAALARQGLYPQAVERLDEALAVPGIAPGWRSLWCLHACEAHFNLGRSIPLQAGFDAALESAGLPPLQGLTAWRRLGSAARDFSRNAAAFAPLPAAGARWREAFALALMHRAQAAYFAGDPPAVTASAMTAWHLLDGEDAADLRAELWAGTAVSAGTIALHALARTLVRRVRRLAPSPAHGRRAAPAWHVTLLYDFACGRFSGVADSLRRCAELAAANGLHRASHEARSLYGKAQFLHGDFAAAQAVFVQLQREAREGGYAMSEHWGLIGAAESALHTGTPELSVVRGWIDRAQVLMRDIEVTDPAYVIRAHGLAARVAWIDGDEAAARAAALAGVRAMQRVPYGIVYMLEGIAGLIETLHAIRARERAGGAVSREIALACAAALRRLRSMSRQFPTFAPRTRLYRGLDALARGSPLAGRLWIEAAHRRALRLDMPYEAARAAHALAGWPTLVAAQRQRWHALAGELYGRCGARPDLDALARTAEAAP